MSKSVIVAFSFLLVLVAGTTGVAPQTVDDAAKAPDESTTINPRFCVRAQPDAPVRLTLIKARSDGPDCTVVLALHNDGIKAVSGYEVEHLAEYEGAGDVWSGTGGSGDPLRPGADLTIDDSWGFTNGLRNGKPVGELKRVQFAIEDITFDDGTEWREPDSLYSRMLRRLGATRPN